MGCVNFRVIATILLVGFYHQTCFVESVPNTTVLITQCNNGVYANGDPFGISVAYVVDDLESATPFRQGYVYRNISPYPNAFAYGEANCNQSLNGLDCGTCLGAAKKAMLSSCVSRIGARSGLVDCSMRFSVYNILNE
ncbi:OLC1v1007388C1 [Oldenlandia corymbosa var. corymbosa]|uniref:OLC1v1007388C1 n=1 Tax=Oldenlandia corymbosa var. corymbosa TaxID=529605 RepID=A0AAV1DJ65_OLDCO|nr:OLC1v1007388C1 [Oldenlandia corymbosa var. corymbosa]